jgi:Rrf2 family protein
MKMNLTTDYAIRAVKCIYDNESRLITSKTISENQDIPQGVLMRVLRQLRIGNIVVSHQGRGEITGGYSLKRPAKDVTFLEIVEIMEGPIALGENLQPLDTQQPSRTEDGRVKKRQQSINQEYNRVSQIIRGEMERYSLEDIFTM